jgi:hypothetical protein
VLQLFPAKPGLQGKHYLALAPALRKRVLEAMQLGGKGGFMEYSVPAGKNGTCQPPGLCPPTTRLGLDAGQCHAHPVHPRQQHTGQHRAGRQLLGRIKATVLMTLLAMASAACCPGFCAG